MFRLCLFLSAAFAAESLCTAASIDVGHWDLNPDEAGQSVFIVVAGGEPLSKMELRAQIVSPVVAAPQPTFEVVNTVAFGGSVWTGPFFEFVEVQDRVVPEDFVSVDLESFAVPAVAATGLLVELKVSTEGVTTGTFDLLLRDPVQGVETNLFDDSFPAQEIELFVTNGTITVPEPAAGTCLCASCGLLPAARRRRRR